MIQNKTKPNLRFPNFNEEWKVISIGDVVQKVSNQVKVINNEFYQEIGIRSHGKGIFHKELKQGTELGNKRVFWVEENALVVNIVFAWEQAVASTTIQEKGMIASHRFPMYIPRNKKCIVNYLLHFFLTPKGKVLLELASPGGAGRNKTLGQNEFLKLSFRIPTLPEQQKIASFFTAIDQKLTHLKRKKTLLEHYKKGVMQKIFAQEIRFKPAGFDSAGFDFAQAAAQPAAEPQAERSRSQGNYPNWERKRLGEIYTFRSTNSFSRENLNYEEGTVKNIHYGDIHTKFKTLFDINNEGVPYINLGVNVEKISSTNYCSTKDLVFADASEDLLDVGKCIEVFNLNNEKVLAGLHTILARPDKFEVALGFGGYLMKSQSVRKQIMKIAQGSKVSSISPSRLSDIELNLPSLPEQTKIANFLSAIDKKIEAVAEAIEATEKWKRGLMQRMFV